MSVNKLTVFLLFLVGGGLLQYWIPIFIAPAAGQTAGIGFVFQNGGLFFFATSVLAMNFYTLLHEFGLSLYKRDWWMSMVFCFAPGLYFVSFCSWALVSGMLNQKLPINYEAQFALQIWALVTAIVYAVYVGFVTGRLKR